MIGYEFSYTVSKFCQIGFWFILDPPTVRVVNNIVHGIVDTTIDLECIIDGNPSPIVTWMHGKEMLTPGEKYQQSRHHGDHEMISSLTITSLNMSDGGNYSCHVNNSDAAKNATGYVKVEVGDKSQQQQGVNIGSTGRH